MTYSDVLWAIYENYSNAYTIIEKPDSIIILKDIFIKGQVFIKVGLKQIKENCLIIDKIIYGEDSYNTSNSYKVNNIDDVIEIIDNEIDRAFPELFVS